MTAKELMEILSQCPEDTIIVYRHNKYGRVDVDKAQFEHEVLYSGKVIKTLTLEGLFKED